MSAKEPKELTDEEFFTQRQEQIKKAEDQMEIYPHKFDVKNTFTEMLEKATKLEIGNKDDVLVSSAGRISIIRKHGKLYFFVVESDGYSIQLIINTSDPKLIEVAEFVRRGDIVGFSGYCGKSKTGEPSVFLEEMKILSPCLRVIPSLKSGLKDAETIYRRRHIDLLVNRESRDRFINRIKIVDTVRSFFRRKDFLEVETPMMHVIHGGAAARPFETYHNELKQKLFMRVAPELYLKKLVVGGLNRVFEIGKNFRNEGIDLTHNPEFTSIEAYMAYGDYEDFMRITEELFEELALTIKGSKRFVYEPVKRGNDEEIKVPLDFSAPFTRLDILDELNKELNLQLTGDNIESNIDILIKAAESRNLFVEEPKTLNRILDKFIGEFLEPRCINPTFITGYPTAMSPLAKEDRNRKGITERFELFVNGKELCNSYTELNIPSIQRSRFQEQMAARGAGDSEAMPIDEDFCKALEYGLPPTGGWGMGIDRLTMYLTNAANIRDVIFFPAMRPENQ